MQEERLDQLMADLDSLVAGTLEGAERVSEIVKNLRRLSFVNPAERRRLDLAQVARNAMQWVLKSAVRPVAVDDQLADELWVDGSEGPLHQVMVNLMQNAVDAMEAVAHPALALSGRRVGDQVVVVLRDNGPGIGGDDLTKVFDPFFTHCCPVN